MPGAAARCRSDLRLMPQPGPPASSVQLQAIRDQGVSGGPCYQRALEHIFQKPGLALHGKMDAFTASDLQCAICMVCVLCLLHRWYVCCMVCKLCRFLSASQEVLLGPVVTPMHTVTYFATDVQLELWRRGRSARSVEPIRPPARHGRNAICSLCSLSNCALRSTFSGTNTQHFPTWSLGRIPAINAAVVRKHSHHGGSGQ
jgi:hypothetical protein